MLTELWAPGLLGYLSHSRKLTAAGKRNLHERARAYTVESIASVADKKKNTITFNNENIGIMLLLFSIFLVSSVYPKSCP